MSIKTFSKNKSISFFKKFSSALILPLLVIPIFSILSLFLSLIPESSSLFVLNESIFYCFNIFLSFLPILIYLSVISKFYKFNSFTFSYSLTFYFLLNFLIIFYLNNINLNLISNLPNFYFKSNIVFKKFNLFLINSFIMLSFFIFTDYSICLVLGKKRSIYHFIFIVFLTPFLFPIIFILLPIFIYLFSFLANIINIIPYGFDNFIYGFTNRLLAISGTQLFFSSIFLFTPIGGYIVDSSGEIIAQGDYEVWIKALELKIPFQVIHESDFFITSQNETIYFSDNLNPGQYSQGFLPIFLFAYPMAGYAISLKEKDKKKRNKILFISILPLLTGVTEIFEFTFIFINPLLYFFNAFMTGISFLLLDLLNVSVGLINASFLDLLFSSTLTYFYGSYTNFYYIFVIGIPIGLLYFGFFYKFYKP